MREASKFNSKYGVVKWDSELKEDVVEGEKVPSAEIIQTFVAFHHT